MAAGVTGVALHIRQTANAARLGAFAAVEELSYYPHLIAKGRGELVSSWFSERGDSLKRPCGENRCERCDPAGKQALENAEPPAIQSQGNSGRRHHNDSLQFVTHVSGCYCRLKVYAAKSERTANGSRFLDQLVSGVKRTLHCARYCRCRLYDIC